MRCSRLAACAMAAIAALVLTGAQRPSAIAQASPGLWEIDGLPGVKAPLRQCIADMSVLVQFEHRGRNCTQHIVSDSAGSSVVDYSCGGAGFGHSKLEVITPRSLRVDTQGVSDRLPFSYVLQARRVGDCQAPAPLSRH